MQNYENFERGGKHENVYNGTRIDSVHPTRPGIDATDIKQWRRLGFYDINQSRKLEDNILFQMLGTKPLTQMDIPFKKVEESISCIDDAQVLKTLFKTSSDLKMPYALPPITEEQRTTLGVWIGNGAPGSMEKEAPARLKSIVKEWNNFFNEKSAEEKLVSRYIYEHLFLAHIYFPEAPETFFRLVRSKNKCDAGIDEIATRRPNDNPETRDFYYCLKYLDTTIVAKTHLPFEFSNKVMNRWKHVFFEEKWKVSKEASYSAGVSENPFVAFSDIPVKSRYQFMLDNSHFIVSTFIKGPVCNGSQAVNSIQEQFYVMFINPDSDTMVKSKEYELKAKDLLILPGVWGSDIKLSASYALTKQIVLYRESYRKLRAEWTHKLKPQGYAITDLWDGNGENPNASLTIFRHNDNAVVMQGFKGDLPKTLFFLDYALMERLVYNLVVNFDVYGNVSHQTLTRIYMDMIRMEAEEIFLSFLPPESRIPLRKSWYKGLLTEAKMKYMFPLVDVNQPTAMKYKDPRNAKQEFVEQVLNNLKPMAKTAPDTLNWKNISLTTAQKKKFALTKDAEVLRELVSVKATGNRRFPNFFPENSYLLVKHKEKPGEVFTIIKNREHENISWILTESLRLAPKEDNLTIFPGYFSFYPNKFFVVESEKLQDFKNRVFKIHTKEDYAKVVKEFAVSRVSDRFWAVYDELNANFKRESPTDFGYLDLTRYDME
ncbi:MAG: fatty acid cis/trans isomerase [Rhizobacter sp.]|nr:fatty acid cis/trans isomerase [Bacteriovorax sp.]